MRIKAEAKVVTFGDLKAAVRAFESQGFEDQDVVNPPNEWLPPESPATRDSFNKSLGTLARAIGEQSARKSLGLVLFMRRNVGNDTE